jgi:hypothetical protein
MALKSLVFLVALLVAPAAFAQTAITLGANPAPIVAASINGQPVRLEVDPRLPDVLVLNRATADRLGLRRLPFAQAVVAIDGGSRVRGRIARPRILFEDSAARAMTGIFSVPVTDRADGVIGPGVLPFDVVTINLGEVEGEMRDIVFTLEDADDWKVQAPIGGERLDIRFAMVDRASIFNRTAARIFDRDGSIVADGELTETPVIVGLRALMQPVITDLALETLPLSPAFARTNAPLLGATEPDALIIEGEGDAPPASVMVGRAALERCVSMSVDRRTRRLTLRCAA